MEQKRLDRDVATLVCYSSINQGIIKAFDGCWVLERETSLWIMISIPPDIASDQISIFFTLASLQSRIINNFSFTSLHCSSLSRELLMGLASCFHSKKNRLSSAFRLRHKLELSVQLHFPILSLVWVYWSIGWLKIVAVSIPGCVCYQCWTERDGKKWKLSVGREFCRCNFFVLVIEF